MKQAAEEIFFSLPHLREVSVRYCRFVSPYVPAGGRSLIEVAMQDALKAGTRARRHGDTVIHSAFLGGLMAHVDKLCDQRMSVQTRDARWVIWDYDQPLHDLMAGHGRKSVQVKIRDDCIPAAPVLIKMLSYICTMRELQLADIWVGFNSGAQA